MPQRGEGCLLVRLLAKQYANNRERVRWLCGYLTPPSRILVVDDDADIRTAFSSLLRDAGYRVTTAIDGRDALDQLDGGLDLILLDLQMPSVGGEEFLVRLRSLPRHGLTPVLVVTSYHDGATLAGAQGVIQKPVAVAELLRRVAEVVTAGH